MWATQGDSLAMEADQNVWDRANGDDRSKNKKPVIDKSYV